MIAVFHETDGSGPTVHRVVSVRNFPGFTVVATAGDLSGMDSPRRITGGDQVLRVVTGVLRRGRYRKVTGLRFPGRKCPRRLIGLWCGIVRRFFW